MVAVDTICMFCGASKGNDPRHADTATRFGALLADRGVRLVFGGGRVGLMGAAADAALAGGGEVVGVIPEHLLRRELGHGSLTKLHVVENMHARKSLMFELSDAVAILPGGLGTLDEAFEVITWKQLGLHDKPILLIDENGYWDPFRALVGSVIGQGFASPDSADLFTNVEAVGDVFDVLDRLPGPAARGDPSKL